MQQRTAAALTAAVLLGPFGLLGCEEEKKKPAPVSAGNDPAQGNPITCAKEAPRLCSMTAPGTAHEYFPKNLRSLCGGKKAGGGGLVLQFCEEGCPKETTIEKMTICVSKELTKAHVVNWGLPDEGEPAVHPMCEQYVERLCHVDPTTQKPNSPEFTGLCGNDAAGPDKFGCGRSHQTKADEAGLHPRCKVIQRCLDTCVNRDGFADCMKNEVLVPLLRENGLGVPPEVTSPQELHYLEKLEASILSETFGTEFDDADLPTHNLRILIKGGKSRHKGDDQALTAYLTDLHRRNENDEFQEKDTSMFLHAHNQDMERRAQSALDLDEAREKRAAQIDRALYHTDDVSDGKVTRQITSQLHINPAHSAENPDADPALFEKRHFFTASGNLEQSSNGLLEITTQTHTPELHDARESPVGRTEPGSSGRPLKRDDVVEVVATTTTERRWVVHPHGTALAQDQDGEVMS